jgi:hypothetical protein
MIPGTLWIPNVVYHEPSKKFIMWFGSGGSVEIRFQLQPASTINHLSAVFHRCSPPAPPNIRPLISTVAAHQPPPNIRTLPSTAAAHQRHQTIFCTELLGQLFAVLG